MAPTQSLAVITPTGRRKRQRPCDNPRPESSYRAGWRLRSAESRRQSKAKQETGTVARRGKHLDSSPVNRAQKALKSLQARGAREPEIGGSLSPITSAISKGHRPPPVKQSPRPSLDYSLSFSLPADFCSSRKDLSSWEAP